MSDAIARLRAEFLSETEDTLAHLQEDLKALEGAAGALPPEVVDRVFRTTHSLKGVAGMFGLDAMSAVAHAMENILDGLRQDRFPLDPALLELSYRGHEALCALLVAADGDETEARRLGQEVIDAVNVAIRERTATDDGEDGSILERTLARLESDEADGVRRALAERRTVAVVEIELSEDGFEEPFRGLLAAIRGWGTVHGTTSTDRDSERRTFHARTIASSGEDLFALIRAVTPLGARILLDEEVPDLRASPATGATDGIPAATAAEEAAAASAAIAADAARATRVSGAPAPAVAPAAAMSFLRIPAERVERLLAELADVVQAKARLETTLVDALEAAGVERTRVTVVRQSLRDLESRLRAMRDGALGMRTVRLEPLFSKLERVFREACRVAPREARFVVQGGGVELDKNAVEALAEPLVHLVRNAVDHGLEGADARAAAGKDPTGTVRVTARAEGRRAVLEVSDDGAGVDFDRVLAKARRLGLVGPDEPPSRSRLIDVLFHPGLTVKDTPTALSGRGVGLDVVRDSVARIGGVLDLETGPSGTVFRLTVPTSLAVLSALEVGAHGQSYFLPLPNIVRALRVSPERIHRDGDEEHVELDGEVVVAREILPDPHRTAGPAVRRAGVLLAAADRRALLWVDRLGRQREITIRSLGDLIPAVPGIAGCAETPDGRTLLVLDPAAMLQTTSAGTGLAA